MFFELFLCSLLLIIYYAIKNRKPANMPPGPYEIPFFGGMPTFDERDAEKLRIKYGDIVTTRTGSHRTVILYDYKVGKEVMARQEFVWRPPFFKEMSLDDQKAGGLVGSVGLQWQHDRRFALRNLRDLGMGKSYLDEAVNIEAKALVEDLRKYKGKPIPFPDSFKTAPLNIIWQMVASTRYELDSPEVDSIYRMTKSLQTNSKLAFLPMFIPALKYLPKPVRDFLFMEHLFKKLLKCISDLLTRNIDEHEEKFDKDNTRDLIDEYLKGMKQESDDPNSLFRKGALLQIINDLFGAGSDTVYNMLKWVAYLLARYPDIAAKMQEEIDSVVPRTRMVSIEDKPNLPHIDAFVVECLRYSAMIVMNVHRTNVQDTTIQGYHIPKDTLVTVCTYRVHYDSKYWTEPEKFSPNRFIDENGKFQAPREGFFTFGSGRRQCLGEPLARMELFLFSAAIIQNFNIRVPDGVKLQDKCESKMGLRVPYDSTLIYEPRDEENDIF